MGSVLLRNGRAMHLDGWRHGAAIDLGIGADGRVLAPAAASAFERVVDLAGAWISPAWIDLHVHCYWGATWLSIRPELVGPATGVGLAVDCGSAGEANFQGLREFIVERSDFPILAHLNISTIGLVAANRVCELHGPDVLDPERTAACVEANRDLIKGIKVRASKTVLGHWGMTPVHVAKATARALGVPLVVHIGDAPPTLDELLDLLEPGDMITHCFTGRITNALDRQPGHLRRVRARLDEGLWIDVGHGQGSFSYHTARHAIAAGVLPSTISTDLHNGNVSGPVWDMPTTMSKMLAVGMTVEDAVERSSAAPARFLRLEGWGRAAAGAPARFTVFDVAGGEERLPDSYGAVETIRRFFEPRYTVLGAEVRPAGRAGRRTGSEPAAGARPQGDRRLSWNQP